MVRFTLRVRVTFPVPGVVGIAVRVVVMVMIMVMVTVAGRVAVVGSVTVAIRVAVRVTVRRCDLIICFKLCRVALRRATFCLKLLFGLAQLYSKGASNAL